MQGSLHSRIALLVVKFVGWVLILCIIGAFLGNMLTVITGTTVTAPEWFKDIALVALGALAGVLTGRGLSDQVQINNTPQNPVPTEPVEDSEKDKGII